jgi:hypothetical protein
MRIKIYLIIALILLGISWFVGYKVGSSTVKDGTITVIESKPVIREVIRYVNKANPKEVDAALNSPIDISRNYSGIDNGCITANIIASDRYKRSIVQDRIKVNERTSYKTELIIGGVAFVVGACATVYTLRKVGVIKINIAQGRF